MGTSTARELTCDRPASYPRGVMYSHPLALRKPGISTGLMSLKAREGFNFNFNFLNALYTETFLSCRSRGLYRLMYISDITYIGFTSLSKSNTDN